MNGQTIQSLPRELSLSEDGTLSIKSLRELETLRHDPVTLNDIKIDKLTTEVLARGAPVGEKVATLNGDAVEIRITIAREQADRKLFGFTFSLTEKGAVCPSSCVPKPAHCASVPPKRRSL